MNSGSNGAVEMLDFFYLIPICIGLGFIGLMAFFWSLEADQFDDLDGAATRILFEDEDAKSRRVG
jgi:cbb3-type cytochrome oxidase maturation protein